MKKIFITLIFGIILYTNIDCQNLIKQIDSMYQLLDTTAYFANMVLSCKDDLVASAKEMEDFELSCSYKRMSDDSIHIYYQHWIEEECNEFALKINNSEPMYVLNLLLNKDGIDQGKIIFEVDTGKLNFNLFDFGKNFKGNLFVFVCGGKYCGHDTHYVTYAPKLGKNAPKVFRKIMRKQPKYLLYCYELEQMNTILYVLNNKIYIYRIVQMKEYELDDYVYLFKDSFTLK
jgi:hypothetical protein